MGTAKPQNPMIHESPSIRQDAPGVRALVAALAVGCALPLFSARVVESPRRIPVAAEADIVIVGGSTGAVSAAVSAARAGAKVCLAAPRPFLGEDMASTLRLWLEPGELPRSELGKVIFGPEAHRGHEPRPDVLPLTYTASLPSDPRHPDSKAGDLLTDGNCHSASQESVQYNGDIDLTIDLGRVRPVGSVTAMIYHRVDYSLAGMDVSISPDGETWDELGRVANLHRPQSGPNSGADPLTLPIHRDVRFIRLHVQRAEGAGRVLLGEVQVTTPGEPDRSTDVTYAAIRPLHLKKVLDEALLSAGVQFFYCSLPTDVIRDSDGRIAGVVVANRSGRQALVGKIVIDATSRATVAEFAGCPSQPFKPGTYTFKRTVIGGGPRPVPDGSVRTIAPALHYKGTTYPVFEYTLRLPLASMSWRDWMKAEQRARDLTAHPDQQFASETLFMVPPAPLVCRSEENGKWQGLGGLPTDVFRPEGTSRLFILGGRAGLSRDGARALLRPLTLLDAGRRLGQAAAERALDLPPPESPRIPATVKIRNGAWDTAEVLLGPRPFLDWPRIDAGVRRLPVLGTWDVVIVGAGTSGAPAAIAAGRQGADTLVLDCMYGMGGVGTLGAISKYCHGYRGGFNEEIPFGPSWKIEQKAEWWRQTTREARADIWFGALGCGAVMDNRRVRGVVVATPDGRGVVLAEAVIDATGNADIAAAAGAPCVTTDGTDVAVQGTGLPPRNLGAAYTNTDFTVSDETDIVDVTSLFVYAKAKYAGSTFDQGVLIDTRERRRIVGDFTVSIVDQVMGRTYPDTVLFARTNYDTHGYTVAPYFHLEHATGGRRFETYLPYRCLLPDQVSGLLVTGLGISVHRDAQPLIRMQPDLQNLGYACGVAAAMAAAKDGSPRHVDVDALQRHLVAKACLPPEVLQHTDSYPLPKERIAEAVDKAGLEYGHVAVILAHRDKAHVLVRKAWERAEDADRRLVYAHLLAVLGDASGVPDLLEEVRRHDTWDEGWNFRAMGQFGSNMSRLDSFLIALAKTGDERALIPILNLAETLDADSDFSHHRAVALALESLGNPRAAPVLAHVLRKPGMMHHALQDVERAAESHTRIDRSLTGLKPRRRSLRELYLARALYRCGDVDGLGEGILQTYRADVRGHLARHAAAVLDTERAL